MKTHQNRLELEWISAGLEGTLMGSSRQYLHVCILIGISMLLSAQTQACPCPPCPPCYSQTGSYPNCNCSYNCTGCQSCVSDSCVNCGGDPTKSCCDNTTCYNSNYDQCCNQGNGHTCPKDHQCCGSSCCDPNPPTCKLCDGEGNCVPKCDDSNNATVYGKFEVGIGSFTDGIEKAIESIRVVDIDADIDFMLMGQLNKKSKCCDICDEQFTTTIWGSTGLEFTVTIEWDVLNIPDINIDKSFLGKGHVKGELEVDLEPVISASGSGTADGIYIGCDSTCWSASGSISASLGGQLEVEGELNVETKTGWNWFDDLFSFYVNAEGNLGISVGASAGGNYYADSAGTCELSGSGFEVGCVSAGEGTFSGSVVFEIKNTNYSAGFDIGLWDGWDNGKCD